MEPKAKKYVKEYGFLSFGRKYKKQIIKKELDTFEKVVHKAGEFIGNKIADAVTKSNDDNIEKQEPVEEIIIPPEKKEEILNKQIEKSIIKMGHCKISKLLTIQLYQNLLQKNGSK